MEIGFILFLVWTYAVYKVGHAQGRLTGAREGAKALARYAQYFNLQNLNALEADAEILDLSKTLSRLDHGGKSFGSYANQAHTPPVDQVRTASERVASAGPVSPTSKPPMLSPIAADGDLSEAECVAMITGHGAEIRSRAAGGWEIQKPGSSMISYAADLEDLRRIARHSAELFGQRKKPSSTDFPPSSGLRH